MACVGDTPAGSTPDANAPDANTADGTAQDTGTPTDSASESAPADGGDATAACSDPIVGVSFALPTSASNATTFPPSVGPLLAGDYKLIGFGFTTGICFPAPCPYNPKSGTAFGGLRVTGLGGSNFVIERRIEVQQATKKVFLDRFNAVYDQINRKVTITRTCTGSGGMTADAGTTWSANVEVLDGGATGKLILGVPDFAVEQIYDGGAAGPAAMATGYFVKQ